MHHEMDDAEIRRFLSAGTRTGKVAWAGTDGQPHVAPIWFLVDEDADELEIVFNTGAESAKGRAMRRDPRISLVVDEETAPYTFVKLTGPVTLSEDLDEVRSWAGRIGGRYMGADRRDEFARRNGVPGELLVRMRPARVIAQADIAD